MNFSIREYKDDYPVSEITTLLHKAYKPLADAGMKYHASYQDDETTLERFSRGTPFLVLDQDKVIGTITLYTAAGIKPGWPPLYAQAGVAHFGQFAVDPPYQKSGVGSMMMDYIERRAIDKGFHTMLFDTSEHATDLIRYYSARGYDFEAYHQWDITNYRSVIMKKQLTPPVAY